MGKQVKFLIESEDWGRCPADTIVVCNEADKDGDYELTDASHHETGRNYVFSTEIESGEVTRVPETQESPSGLYVRILDRDKLSMEDYDLTEGRSYAAISDPALSRTDPHWYCHDDKGDAFHVWESLRGSAWDWAPGSARPVDTVSQARKNTPLYSGCIAYFPDALEAVARLSKFGNDKHNPGEPLHWSRDKSADHADCVARHLKDHGKVDPTSKFSHTVGLAWRALALLQVEIETAGSPDLDNTL